jgi:lipase chaperone LimK
VNDNLFTEPGPRDRLLEALDPQGDIDLGLAVVIAHDLTDDTATVLTELIQKRIARVPAEDQDHDEPNDQASDALRRLIRALQPADDAQRGLLLAVVTLLGGDTSSRLADLVERANADAYDRGYRDRAEGH